MRNPLEEAILRTVLWFSLFEYPLTSFEIWKWMLSPGRTYRLGEVIETLAHSKELKHHLREEEGVYQMRDETTSATIRRERFADAIRKFDRLQRVTTYLKRLPFVRGVATCNTLAWMHTRPESDIDLFVIVKEGSIWTSRLLAVAPFALLRARPGECKEDPVCFSFFLSDTSLNLESLRVGSHDPYLAYWSQSLLPVFDRDGVFKDFQKANRWAGEFLGHSYGRDIASEESVARPASSFSERCSRALQRRRFPQVITQMANRDSRVVVSDAMLKFHANDRRENFRDQYIDRCRQFNVSYEHA